MRHHHTIERKLSILATVALLCGSAGCTNEVLGDDAQGGPCEPVGSWIMSYTADGPADVANSPAISDQHLLISETAAGFEVALDGSVMSNATLLADGCELHMSSSTYWEAGNEPWKDVRDYTVHLAGDLLSGKLVYGCNWCPDMDMTYEYTIGGVRSQ